MPTKDRVPATPARPRPRPARRIDEDTSIIPHIIAQSVMEEAIRYLGEPLPRRWVRELVVHADTVYAHNDKFRRALKRDGDRGRDWLWSFMRHWLSSLILQHRPQLHSRLPASYSVGQELPPLRSQ
jgi:hypothetical protein